MRVGFEVQVHRDELLLWFLGGAVRAGGPDSHPERIPFRDVDSWGLVWHGHYFSYVDQARLDLLKLRAFKQRFSVDAEILLRYADGEFLTGHGGQVATIADKLGSLLRTHPGIQTAAFETLAVREGVSRARVRGYLSEGVLAGRIRRESEAGGNSKRLYLNVEENGFDYGQV